MDEVRALVAEIERLAPFPDVIKALQKLKDAGLKLVILSNGDPDMLETGVKFSGTEDLWTRVVSVAEAGAFKPHFNTYAIGAKAVNLALVGGVVRGEPCVRLRGRQGSRYAHRVRRPAQPTVRQRVLPADTGRRRLHPPRQRSHQPRQRLKGSRDVPEAMLPGTWAWSERGRSVRDGVGEPRRDLQHHVHGCIQVELAVRHLAVRLSGGGRRPCP